MTLSPYGDTLLLFGGNRFVGPGNGLIYIKEDDAWVQRNETFDLEMISRLSVTLGLAVPVDAIEALCFEKEEN